MFPSVRFNANIKDRSKVGSKVPRGRTQATGRMLPTTGVDSIKLEIIRFLERTHSATDRTLSVPVPSLDEGGGRR